MNKQKSTYYLAGAVSLVTFGIYLFSLRNKFLEWDDNIYVFENLHIRSLDLSLLKWSFSDFYAGNWHPLTWISHAVDYAVWGLNPLGHHLTNVILHAVNTFLVVLVAVKLTGAADKSSVKHDAPTIRDGAPTLITAVVTGLLFGLHPIHVESVAWVAERKDLLCALFFLLGVRSYMSYVTYTTYGKRHYLFSLLFFILALLSKPMAVSFPVVLLILDRYPLGRIQSLKTFRAALVEKIPYAVLSLLSSVITVLAQRSGGALAPLEFVPLSTRLIAAPYFLLAYLRKMVLPLNLLPFYAYPNDISLSSLRYLFALVTVAGITAACLVIAKKKGLWSAVWGYYVVTLLPVIGIVQVGSQAMADRYTYLPSLGPFIVVGLAAARAYGKANKVKKRVLFLKLIGVTTAAFMVISMSYLTFQQIGIWRSGIRLWSYAIERENDVSLPYYNRGYAFFKQGMLDSAVVDFDRAIALNPRDFRAYASRGMVFTKRGWTGKAISDFSTAVELNPSYYKAYMRLGVLYGEAGLFDKAIENLSRAILINPDEYAAYNDRGFSYFITGRYDSALRDFDRAIELNGNYALPYFNRGRLFLGRGDKTLAIADFQKACELGNAGGCNAAETLRETAANPVR